MYGSNSAAVLKLGEVLMKKLYVALAFCLSLVGVTSNAEEVKAADQVGDTSEQSVMQWLGTELEKLGTSLKERFYPEEQTGAEALPEEVETGKPVEEATGEKDVAVKAEEAGQALEEGLAAEVEALKL